MKYIVLIFVILINGCATSYQANGFSGGYSETWLNNNIVDVYFNGNGYTSKKQTSDFALYRAAELTIKNKSKFFIIINNKENISTSINTFYNPFNKVNQVYTTHKPSDCIRIFILKKSTNIPQFAIDANFIIKQMHNKYGENAFNNKQIRKQILDKYRTH